MMTLVEVPISQFIVTPSASGVQAIADRRSAEMTAMANTAGKIVSAECDQTLTAARTG